VVVCIRSRYSLEPLPVRTCNPNRLLIHLQDHFAPPIKNPRPRLADIGKGWESADLSKWPVEIAYCAFHIAATEVVLPDFLCSESFNAKRAVWATNVFEAFSVPGLAELLTEFEAALQPIFLKEGFLTKDRKKWQKDVMEAKTTAQLVKVIYTLERSMRWEALTLTHKKVSNVKVFRGVFSDDDERMVESILEERTNEEGDKEYKIRYAGLGEAQDEWLPVYQIFCLNKLWDFHRSVLGGKKPEDWAAFQKPLQDWVQWRHAACNEHNSEESVTLQRGRDLRWTQDREDRETKALNDSTWDATGGVARPRNQIQVIIKMPLPRHVIEAQKRRAADKVNGKNGASRRKSHTSVPVHEENSQRKAQRDEENKLAAIAQAQQVQQAQQVHQQQQAIMMQQVKARQEMINAYQEHQKQQMQHAQMIAYQNARAASEEAERQRVLYIETMKRHQELQREVAERERQEQAAAARKTEEARREQARQRAMAEQRAQQERIDAKRRWDQQQAQKLQMQHMMQSQHPQQQQTYQQQQLRLQYNPTQPYVPQSGLLQHGGGLGFNAAPRAHNEHEELFRRYQSQVQRVQTQGLTAPKPQRIHGKDPTPAVGSQLIGGDYRGDPSGVRKMPPQRIGVSGNMSKEATQQLWDQSEKERKQREAAREKSRKRTDSAPKSRRFNMISQSQLSGIKIRIKIKKGKGEEPDSYKYLRTRKPTALKRKK